VVGDQSLWKMWTAMHEQDEAKLRQCVQEDPELLDPLDGGALHVAAEYGWLRGAEVLLECGAEVDGRDMHGITPLLIAVSEESLPMCRFLLDRGADPNAMLPDGTSPLSMASMLAGFRDERFLELMLARGARHDICSAVNLGSIDLVRDLLRANPNAIREHPARARLVADAVHACERRLKSQRPRPCLGMFTKNNIHYLREMLELLIEHGADVNGIAGTKTALEVALPDVEAVKLLIELGADVNLSAVPGSGTPLDTAYDLRYPTIPILLAHGARQTREPIDIFGKVAQYLEPLMDPEHRKRWMHEQDRKEEPDD